MNMIGYWLSSWHHTVMSVLLIIRPKCTLVASHAGSWWITVSMPTGQTDIRMDAR